MRAATPTEAQVRRAVKGALSAGFAVGAVEIAPDGTIRILPDAKRSGQDSAMNPADLIDMSQP